MNENKHSWLKQNWMQLASLILSAVLLAVVLEQQNTIGNLESRILGLDNELERINDSVYSISGRVADGIEQAGQPVETSDLKPTGLDREQKALLAEMSVTLKSWQEDTKAVLVVKLGETSFEIPMAAAGNGTYTAPLSLPTEGQQELTMAVAVERDGVFTRQELGGWGYVSMLLPYQRNGWGGPVWEGYQDGVLRLSPDTCFDICDREYQSVRVNDPQFRVYRNGALVWEEAAYLDPNLTQESYYTYYLEDTAYFADATAEQPEPVEIACAPGDEILVAFACTDDSGLGYEFTHTRLTITETGPEEAAPLMSDESPRLHWPE